MKEAQEKNGKKEDEMTPEERDAAQMSKLAQAQDNLQTSQRMGQTKAELKRSAAWVEESAEDVGTLTASSNEGAKATLKQMETGIANLERSQQELTADAQELTEEASQMKAPDQQEDTAQQAEGTENSKEELTTTEEIQQTAQSEEEKEKETEQA